MISTGNDIVALGSINKTRTCDPRFYSKILSAVEQELYYRLEFATLLFENYVWLLWSVKESAFKYLQRNNHQLIFSPTKISVLTVDLHADQHYSGSLQFGQHHLFFRSTITNDWISTVVNEDDDFEYIFNDVQAIEHDDYEYQSVAVRRFALNKLNTFFEDEFLLEKSEANYPVLVKNGKRVNTPVSLSHDGHFVACSFNFNPTLQ